MARRRRLKRPYRTVKRGTYITPRRTAVSTYYDWPSPTVVTPLYRVDRRNVAKSYTSPAPSLLTLRSARAKALARQRSRRAAALRGVRGVPALIALRDRERRIRTQGSSAYPFDPGLHDTPFRRPTIAPYGAFGKGVAYVSPKAYRCVQRKIRREAVFAQTGGGSIRRKPRNTMRIDSQIRCR